MTMLQDDFPARLVRAAALQLGSQHLTDRYAEEWLSSLPSRDRYLRWRYALSLFLRGARATRWTLRYQAADGALSALAGCLLVIPAAALLLMGYYEWNVPREVVQESSLIGWCLMTAILIALSSSYRSTRQAVYFGILLSLIQTGTGTEFFQGGEPLGWSVSGAWHAMQAADCLGAALGGIAIVVRYRTPLLVRTSAGLGVSALFAGAYTFLGAQIPEPLIVLPAGNPNGFWVDVAPSCSSINACYGPDSDGGQFFSPFSGWVPLGDSNPPGIAAMMGNFLTAVAWGAETILLGALVAIALRLVSLAISLLRASEIPHQDHKPEVP